MLRKIVLSILVTASLMANSPKVKTIDVNQTVMEFITDVEADSKKNGGWLIKDRNISLNGESFISILSKYKSGDDTYDELIGLTFKNDVNYTKDSYRAVSTLVDYPVSDLDKNETASIKKIIDNKLVVLKSDYSVTNHQYNLSLNDINETLNNTKVKISGVTLNGFYDINKPLNENAKMSIKSIDFTPLAKQFLGEYFRLNNLVIDTKTAKRDKVVDLKYKVSIDLVDFNDTKRRSLVEKANLDIKIGNLDASIYEELEELGSQNPALIDDKKIEELSNRLLLSKGLFIEIVDLSSTKLVDKDNKMGSTKVRVKVSLDDVKSSSKAILINPALALSFLNVDAKIELSQEMLTTIMKDPRAMMLAMFPPKKEKNKTVYVIKYSKGKLVVNGFKL